MSDLSVPPPLLRYPTRQMRGALFSIDSFEHFIVASTHLLSKSSELALKGSSILLIKKAQYFISCHSSV